MIFSRRAIQRRLNELRPVIGDGAIDDLVARLNRPGTDRMSAMWEVAFLHGLASTGSLRYEIPLSSGRRPDIELEAGPLRIVADVVCVGDEGLDRSNPYEALSDALRKAQADLKLPIGGLALRIEARRTVSRRGVKTVLRLPPPSRLQPFVDEQVVPQLREQLQAGERVLRVAFNDGEAGVSITIDPSQSPYNSGSFAAYDAPGIKDRNPLYAGLERKAKQLRAAGCLTGIFVGDGDCRAMAARRNGQDGFSPEEIVQEFFRQYSSVDFVLLVTVVEDQRTFGVQKPERRLHASLRVRDGCSQIAELETLCRQMMVLFPKPIMMPVNAARRARESEYDIGHHGGCQMGGHKVKVSLREMIEVLAGERTFADDGAKYVEAARRSPRRRSPNPIQAAIQDNLAEGRLPVSMTVIDGGEDDNDGWVEIEFGEPDPAITPFR